MRIDDHSNTSGDLQSSQVDRTQQAEREQQARQRAPAQGSDSVSLSALSEQLVAAIETDPPEVVRQIEQLEQAVNNGTFNEPPIRWRVRLSVPRSTASDRGDGRERVMAESTAIVDEATVAAEQALRLLREGRYAELIEQADEWSALAVPLGRLRDGIEAGGVELAETARSAAKLRGRIHALRETLRHVAMVETGCARSRRLFAPATRREGK